MAKPVKKKQRVEQVPATTGLPAEPPAAAGSRFWIIAAGLILAVVLIYVQTGSHQFVNYDDPDYVLKNANVNRGVTAQGIAWAFRTFDYFYWQPLTWISHMIDCQIFGLNAGPHHLVSMALHAANAVLLFLAMWRLTGALFRSGAAAALFALHPLRVESVAWVAERKDVLSGLFWMLTLVAYAAYVRQPVRRRYVVVIAAFVCAIMSKPTTVTLPFVLLLLDWWPLRRFGMAAVKEKMPMLAIAAGASLLTFAGQHQMGATISMQALPMWFRLYNAVVAYVRYLGKMIWPANLGALYPFEKISTGEMLGCLLLLLAITGFVLAQSKRRGYLAMGWLWFAGAMVPMIGLAQTGFQAYADRFTYLPMIGLAVAIVWAFADLRLPLFVNAAVAGLGFGVLSFLSLVQASHWRDSLTLFSHTVAVTRDNDIMHLNLSALYQERGDLEKASGHLEEVLRIAPENTEARAVAGNLYLKRGLPDTAKRHFEQALQRDPRHIGAHRGLAEVYIAKNDREAARRELIEVLRISPSDFEARARLVMLGTPSK